MSTGSKQWPEDFPYRFFIGMHTVDQDLNGTIPRLLHDLDGRKIIRQLADAGIDAVYFYFSCHCGSCFYPTELEQAHTHSGLKGRDVFGDAADEARKLKLAFIGVYEFQNLRLEKHGPKEWQHYYPDAAPGQNCGLCWNTGYGELVLKQIEEVAGRYPLSGMYIDMLDHPGLVCCEGCARRFKEETGALPPRKPDPGSALYKAFRLWTFKETARFIREMRGVLQRYQPEATLLNNSHIILCEDLYETTDANSYLGHDPTIGFTTAIGPVALSAKMAVFRALSRGKFKFEILSDPILCGLLSVMPPDPYNAVTAMAHAQGAASAYPSSMIDQYGQLNPAVLALTKKSSAFAKARYPWQAAGESVRFAGLYLSQESELFYAATSRQGFLKGNYNAKYMDEFHGAYLMLQQEHVPVDILTRRDLGRLSEYPVVYLPNAVCMGKDEADAFRNYVRTGGMLVASYRTSLANEWHEEYPDFALADVFGVRFRGKKLEPNQGLQLVLPAGLFATEDWENRNITLPQAALLCETLPGAETLAPLHDRYRPDGRKSDVGLVNAYTQEKPVGPGVVHNGFGKGQSVYFAGKIFSAFLHTGIPSLKKLAARWILQDVRDARLLVWLEAPSSVEMTAFAQPERKRILVHLVNYQSAPGRIELGPLPMTEDVLPVCNLELILALRPDQVQRVILQPEGLKLEVKAREGKSLVILPRIHIHHIVEILLKEKVCPEYPNSNRVFDYPRYDLKEKVQAWLRANPTPGASPDTGWLSFDRWNRTQFLTAWMVAGPFYADPKQALDRPFGPEKELFQDPAGIAESGPAMPWIDARRAGELRTEFFEMYAFIGQKQGHEPGLVGYARCWLHSENDQTVRFCVGNDDGCKIFINREMVYRDEGSKNRNIIAQEFAAELPKGLNPVLVKKVNIGHGLGFYLGIEDSRYKIVGSATPEIF